MRRASIAVAAGPCTQAEKLMFSWDKVSTAGGAEWTVVILDPPII
jgi:hypothetical protein